MGSARAWLTSTDANREGQGVSHDPAARARRARRNGVTLLELIVVLALLGLILAIAAPSFILPSPSAQDANATALIAARRQAVIRGEPVTVSINGTRVHISPLGTCVPESTARDVRSTWDAIGCTASTTRADAPAR